MAAAQSTRSRPSRGTGKTPNRSCARRGIAHLLGHDSHGNDLRFDGEPNVKLVSMYSSMGLEFGLAVIPAMDWMPGNSEDEAGEAKLLHVAMTRATERPVMACIGESGFAGRVEGVVKAVREAAVAARPVKFSLTPFSRSSSFLIASSAVLFARMIEHKGAVATRGLFTPTVCSRSPPRCFIDPRVRGMKGTMR